LLDRTQRPGSGRTPERAILVGVLFPETPTLAEHPLDELARLAATAGAHEVGRVIQRRVRPSASTFLGRGKAQEIAALARERGADVILADADLSPAQIRNLEKILECRVVDRTELILDIFAQHARSHQARLQVELAQTQYVLPRLKRMWTHLSREVGGGQSGAGGGGPGGGSQGGSGQGGAGQGIGTRGPGEKQIEIDRRLLRRRITELKRELKEIAARRERMAQSRERYFTVSLVGYTNAGKSTLQRALTGSDAYVADQLFATLDTQTRAWELPHGKRIFLSDTVGFIRNLPHHLVASFYATLEEVRTADLVLHVVDGSHPDARLQMEAVEGVLTEIGAEATPRLLVLNKSDRVGDPLDLRLLAAGRDPWISVSATTREGLSRLEEAVLAQVQGRQTRAEFLVPAGAGRLLAFLAERGTILERRYEGSFVALTVLLSAADYGRAGRMLSAQSGG